MSELAAFILLAFREDAARAAPDPHLQLLLAESGSKASAFVLFDQLMKNANQHFYISKMQSRSGLI